MAEITKLNSQKGLVTFTEKDLIEFDLIRYIRTSVKGVGKRSLLQDVPFEQTAAKAFLEKYPGHQVKIAEKCLLNDDNSVDVILKIAQDVSRFTYNTHPTKTIFKHQEKKSGK